MSDESVTVLRHVWRPLPLGSFRAFVDGYRAHPAGHAHRLHLIFQGFETEAEAAPHRALLGGIGHDVTWRPDREFDLGAYRDVARAVDTAFILGLNAHAWPVAAKWVANLMAAFRARPDCGLAGASGSWEWSPGETDYPNPHVRSNGFLIRRELFLSLVPNAIRDKADCMGFECGPDGWVPRLRARGLEPYLVAADGEILEWRRWNAPGMFRVGEQERLMILDNRTEDYRHSSTERRRDLAAHAWADRKPRRSLPRRIRERLARVVAGRVARV